MWLEEEMRRWFRRADFTIIGLVWTCHLEQAGRCAVDDPGERGPRHAGDLSIICCCQAFTEA